MTQPPDRPTQPIPSDATHEQPAAEVPAVDTASPAWASAAQEGDGSASARPVPVAGAGSVPPSVLVAPATPAVEKKSWASRASGGRGLAAGALVVGLGLGVVAGSAATWAVTHDDRGTGATVDGNGRFDHDREGDFGPPGGRGGTPPGGQLPDGVPPQNGPGGGTGQVPGGGTGTGTDDSTGSDANGTAQTT